MSQTKTPPWESAKQYSQCTDIEKVFLWVWVETHHDIHKPTIERAWSELCALQAVAEAVEKYLNINPVQENVALAWVQIEAALKEWRAICPK